MQLTDDQKNAATAFTAFMVSPQKEMIISGPAGVGKTTLLKHILNEQNHVKIQQLIGDDVMDEWQLTATTNKAAEVMAVSTNEPVSTIHSALGIRVFNNFETGKQTLSRTDKSVVLSNKLIVIDECSMIDTQLDRLIQESTINCKILYVGDHCQMAPVMEKISPIFVRNTPVQINQIVRSQHTPAITALSKQLREIVETDVFTPILAVPGVIDYLTPEEAEQELIEAFVNTENKDPDLSPRILAYRNKQVMGFNDWIRTKRGLPKQLQAGEWVISNASTNILHTSRRLKIEQDILITRMEGPQYDYQSKDVSIAYYVCTNQHGDTFPLPVDYSHVDALIKYYANKKDWPKHYELKEKYADLRPRDACTVYKAQGSTYHTVFVDLKDISTCTNREQVARMLYVACTRATHRICFIGQLSPRFFT